MPFAAALPAITGVAGLLGRLFGNSAKESANQRIADNASAAQRNALLASLYNTQQNATTDALRAGSAEKLAQGNQDLDQRKFALGAPSVRAGQSVRGSIMQNAQPFTVSGLPDKIQQSIPQISGGLSPALFNADTRDLGGELTRKALIDQLKGDTFDPMTATDFSGGVLSPPALEDYAAPGGVEKGLGGAGLLASILGTLGEGTDAWRKRRPSYEPGDETGWG